VADLNGKAVLITGAKGGLGNFVTKAFLDAGASVVGVSRAITASDFNHPRFIAAPAKITSKNDADAVVADTLRRLGKLDVLVHLIGGYAGGTSVEDTTDETFEEMVDLNFRAAFYMVRAVLPSMRAQGSGRILAIGSRAAVEPQALAGAYSASKAALVALMKSVALENHERGVGANVVLPGTMDTPVNRAAMPGADFSKWVNPEFVARLLVFLSGEDALQLNGTVIPVYGREG
jgi:NAD(P)-dependent dehydrogenase (short-subunit alcohol dehydrogenase family)